MEKQIKTTTIYEGRILSVTQDQVLLDNKKTAYREIVHHNGGVGILAIQNHEILLVKQYRYAQQQDTIEIPAGKIEKGETPYNTALREIEEETGYQCQSLTLFSKVLPTPGYCTEILYLYEANALKKIANPRNPDEDEVIKLIKVDLQEAYQMVLDLKITDAKTIIAIMYAYQKYK